jgi:hypothetical protein
MKTNSLFLHTILAAAIVTCSATVMARNAIQPITPIKPLASSYSPIEKKPVVHRRINQPPRAQHYAHKSRQVHRHHTHRFGPVKHDGRRDIRHNQWHNNRHPQRQHGSLPWK